MDRGQRPKHSTRPLRAGLVGSVALHGAAAALTLVALAWRTVPTPPGAPPAVQMLWLPPAEVAPEAAAPMTATPAAATPGAAAEIAPLGPAVAEGLEPEDALATLVGVLTMPAAPEPAAASLPPLPIPEMEAAELPADPTTLFAVPPQIASLTVPRPAPVAAPEAALPLPPPLPPAPPPQRAAARPSVPPVAQPATSATAAPRPPSAVPAPPLPEPAAIPFLSGAPRFRRPPAPPAYPDRAREAGIEGTALLRLRVTADGATQEIRLLRSAGNRQLDEAAQAAARRWEIAPALQGGRPIEAWVEVPVRFRLDE